MQSIRGIYNGKTVVPLDTAYAPPNSRVIITFLDEPADLALTAIAADHALSFLSGSWQDTRSAEEIVCDIYESRVHPSREVNI